MAETIKVKQNWCLTADRTRVVPETSPEARWLHWAAGTEVDLDEAVRLGAVVRKAPARSHHKAKPKKAASHTPKREGGW